jgi:hypothetical protein
MKLAADLGTGKAIQGELPTYHWIEVLGEAQWGVARLPGADSRKGPNRRS